MTGPLPTGARWCAGSGDRWLASALGAPSCPVCARTALALAVPPPRTSPVGGWCGHVPSHAVPSRVLNRA